MKRSDSFPFRSSKEEIKQTKPKVPQKGIPTYPLAFLDQDFMLRRDLRHIRLQLEFLKAEMTQQENEIASTIVVFGSARTLSTEDAEMLVETAKIALAADPKNSVLQSNLKKAEHEARKSVYYGEARRFAQIVSQACQVNHLNDLVIVTGGGPGIMEAANRGAYDVDAKSIGLNIFLPKEQGSNPYITPELNFQFHYFAIRKMHFLIRSRALIFFPGGYGTFDELFETLTLMQTQKIRKIPIILFSHEYWSKAINFDFLVEEGFIDPEDISLFTVVETAEEAWKHITEFYQIDPLTCEPLETAD